MFARKVHLKLKPNCAIEFSRLYEQELLPILRQQPGFRDGMTLVSGQRTEAIVLSFWDKRANADAFRQSAYPALIERLASILAEAPQVSTLLVSNSTSHALAMRG